MPPVAHCDYLCGWAKGLGVPILAIDYRKVTQRPPARRTRISPRRSARSAKCRFHCALTLRPLCCALSQAPEDPYPAGLLDSYEVYRQLVETEGRVVGMNEADEGTKLRVALVGDSSGGNLAAALTLKAIVNGQPSPQPTLPCQSAARPTTCLDADVQWVMWAHAMVCRCSAARWHSPHLPCTGLRLWSAQRIPSLAVHRCSPKRTNSLADATLSFFSVLRRRVAKGPPRRRADQHARGCSASLLAFSPHCRVLAPLEQSLSAVVPFALPARRSAACAVSDAHLSGVPGQRR